MVFVFVVELGLGYREQDEDDGPRDAESGMEIVCHYHVFGGEASIRVA